MKAKKPITPPTFEEKYKDFLPYIYTLSERIEGLNNRVLELEKYITTLKESNMDKKQLKFYTDHHKEYVDAYNSGCEFEKELIIIELLRLVKIFSDDDLKKEIDKLLNP